MRIKVLLLLLLLLPLSASAYWTGIAAFAGESQSDWRYAGGIRQARLNQYGLQVEEKTALDLRVGASAGQFSLRLLEQNDVNLADKFYGQFISFYLRLPVRINHLLSLHGKLNYQFNLGKKTLDTLETEVSWNEISFDLGLNIQLGALAIRPLMNFRSLNGDTSEQSVARVFSLDKQRSSGLQLDYLLEPAAYVRLTGTFEDNPSLQISFVREY
ncbi:MAG: hypothetical protein ISR73_04170 [Gammaproteobacteria bacterium]|nr:hypothetical protein [Gammaproteobacteria bacterium]